MNTLEDKEDLGLHLISLKEELNELNEKEQSYLNIMNKLFVYKNYKTILEDSNKAKKREIVNALCAWITISTLGGTIVNGVSNYSTSDFIKNIAIFGLFSGFVPFVMYNKASKKIERINKTYTLEEVNDFLEKNKDVISNYDDLLEKISLAKEEIDEIILNGHGNIHTSYKDNDNVNSKKRKYEDKIIVFNK